MLELIELAPPGTSQYNQCYLSCCLAWPWGVFLCSCSYKNLSTVTVRSVLSLDFLTATNRLSPSRRVVMQHGQFPKIAVGEQALGSLLLSVFI